MRDLSNVTTDNNTINSFTNQGFNFSDEGFVKEPANKNNTKNILEAEFVEEEKKSETKKKKDENHLVSYLTLFRFATKFEKFLVFIAIICSICGSIYLPYAVIIYGEFTTLLVDRTMRVGTSTKTILLNWFGGGQILTNPTEQEAYDAILADSVAFGVGCFAGCVVVLVFNAISVDILNLTAFRQIKRIRIMFLESVLRQDMIWYDTNTSENFATRVTEDLDKLKEGIGEKLAICLNLVFAFLISVIMSFIYGWKLTLVILSCAPFIILSTAFNAKMQGSLTEKELKSYSSAGNVAEEVLGSIRTVVAFGGHEKELNRYKKNLRPAELNGKKKGLFSGIGGGIMWIIIYGVYALAFWYGIILILDDRDKIDKEYTPAVLIIVLFGVLAGAQNLGLTSTHLEAFAAARGSAYSIFKIIDRKPIIDSLSEKGLKPKSIEGNIKFSDVRFNYPARSDVQVLNGLNLEIKSGQTVALVGPSGCGKSTCLQLIQRLYDPLSGSVEIDGVKLSELNIQWIRSKIGVVGQEPVLFATTIRENIRYGNPSCTDEEIEKAARIANCHHFILKLPNGYETLIGERGAQLSGGQKQRVAIARALVRNPRILLLDEATSALDPTSEKQVQNALERASKGRTTIVVSHRLSTIFNADKIILIKEGIVMEEGSHAELMKTQGMYYELVNANKASSNKDTNAKLHHRRHSKLKRMDSFSSQSQSESESSDSDEESDSEDTKETEEKFEVSNYRLFKMNAPEWPYITVGCVAAVTMGASFPAFAVLFGEMYGILSIEDVEEIKGYSNFYSLLFLVLGVVAGLAVFLQTYMFSVAGVRLTSRLRAQTFGAMMKQEMAWFDETKNGVGALCSRLSSDCSSVQGATGSRIGSFLQAGSVIFIGIGVSLYYSWKMTLVASVSIPLVLFFVFMESRFMQKVSLKEKDAMENATKMAVEAISNIRTVASLCQEPHIINRYVKEIENVDEFCRKKSRLRGSVFGLGQTVPMMCYGLSLWYGGTLIANKEMRYEDAIKVGEALIFGSWMLGQALAYAPNVSIAIISAAKILKLLDREPCMKNPKSISDIEPKQIGGNVNYRKVEFHYPTRSAVTVLNGLDLCIPRGQTIALVGSSGCGKSTCMQLILRYYDPVEGKIDIDGIETTDFPLDVIRSHLGLVSQEPVLFDRTIAENIAYGDNSRSVIMDEIIDAAKAANIHEFIMSLPLQYDTGLGSKGTQLSGGQKQRIAIARALVRNPKILLLDEATSALDTHSEKVVQAALDKARFGRTCIVIAHRLTTIQNADLICVIENGQVVEKGTHDQLMEKGDKYAKHYEMQQVE